MNDYSGVKNGGQAAYSYLNIGILLIRAIPIVRIGALHYEPVQ